VEQLNPNPEVLQFSENTIGNKSTEYVSSAPISTNKDDEVLALIGDGSIHHSALQNMGAWPIQISDSFCDFMVKRDTSQVQNSDILLRTKVGDQ
jgi:hypothetical protein